MDVEFLRANAIDRRLERFIDEFDELHWSVAWATKTPLADALLANAKKFENVTFGVAFSQTDPDIVDALVGIPNAYVATKFSGGTYHPKVYAFRKGRRAAAIVGSANFTRGGLGNNHEAAVAMTGAADEAVFKDIFAFTRDSAGFGQKVTVAYAAAYRASCKRAAALPKPPRDPVGAIPPARAKTELLTAEWAQYARSTRASPYHDVDKSLELLAIARRWYAENATFADFSTPQRKAVAGIIGKYQKIGPDLNRDWGWFGSMRGMGDFANRVDNGDAALVRAIDGIPRSGDVTRAQYERFCSQFRKAFASSTRTGGVPTASRLLAMKRPDTFLCVCKPNIGLASEVLGFARTTLDLGNYWERVVEPIRSAVWYNADKPDGVDGELWEGRAAMLDALFYRP